MVCKSCSEEVMRIIRDEYLASEKKKVALYRLVLKNTNENRKKKILGEIEEDIIRLQKLRGKLNSWDETLLQERIDVFKKVRKIIEDIL